MTFGKRLKLARQNKKFTQKNLANAIGAKHNSVSNWENDQNKPDPDTIELICGVLGISANYLLGTKDLQVPVSPEALEIAKAYDKAEIDKQNIVRVTLGLDIKKNSKITELSKKTLEENAPEHLQTIAAHLDGNLTDEVKDFIDNF